MQKKCRRCGDKFTVKKSEDYCPECEKVMTPPGAGVSKIITCECCGEDFTYTKEKPLGRWSKYCPTCASKLSKPYKKDTSKTVEDSNKTEAPPATPEPSPKLTTCKVCGKEFEQTGKGRPAVNCPECREALKHEYKPKAKPTVSVATEEEKSKLYGKIEPKTVVSEKPSTGLPIVDGTLTATMNDAVHHPAHYTLPRLTVESVDVIRAVLTPEEFKGWCKGNALKYSLRAGRKDPAKEVQDLAKAGVFLSWITGE